MKWPWRLLLLRSDVKLYEQLLPAAFALTVKDVCEDPLCLCSRETAAHKHLPVPVTRCDIATSFLMAGCSRPFVQYRPSYTAAQTADGQAWHEYCFFL